MSDEKSDAPKDVDPDLPPPLVDIDEKDPAKMSTPPKGNSDARQTAYNILALAEEAENLPFKEKEKVVLSSPSLEKI